jgi:hypothetical protein
MESSGTNGGKPPQSIEDALRALLVQAQTNKDEPKDRYKFWETQPVAQFGDDVRTYARFST